MVILELLEKVSATADGDTITLPVASPDDAELAAAWCARTGNTLVAADDTSITIRRGRPPDPIAALPEDRRPGARLWLYTNFDCNLACDYCCARSSPQTERRALGVDRVQQIAKAAPNANTSDLRVPGGWDLHWWVDRGRFVVRGDGYGSGWVEGGLWPEPVCGAFDPEVGHLAFDDAGVRAPAAQGQRVPGYLPYSVGEGCGQAVRGKRPPAR